MSDSPKAPDVTFALTVTPEPLPDDSDEPCAYCNPDDMVAEREHSARQKYGPDADLPDDVGIVKADYMFRMGHEEGAGVVVPVCDSCLVECSVEAEGQTTRSELDYVYWGEGTIAETVTETNEKGTTVHRKVPVNSD